MVLDQRERSAVLAGLLLLEAALESEQALEPHTRSVFLAGGDPPLRERQLDELRQRIFREACSPPTVVLKTYCAPVVNEVFATSPVRVVLLDEDVEGSDAETVGQVEGQEVWIGVFDAQPDEDRVEEISRQVATLVRSRTPRPQTPDGHGA
jgi:hypothetical protein